jgi:hypothetical protein
MGRELRVNRDRTGGISRAREGKWSALREAKKRWVVATSVTFALTVLAGYQSEQASFFSSSGKVWAIVGLCLLVLSFVFGGFASKANERMRVDANRDGLFLLEALGRYGTDSDSKVGREVHDLLWSVALYLKEGQAVPDGIRNEAIRVAEQALGRDADATDEAR